MQNIDNKFTAENQENLNNAFRKILEHHLSFFNKISQYPMNVISVESETVNKISDEIHNWDAYNIINQYGLLYLDSMLYSNYMNIMLGGDANCETKMIDDYDGISFILELYYVHISDIFRILHSDLKMKTELKSVWLDHRVDFIELLEKLKSKPDNEVDENTVSHTLSIPHQQITINVSLNEKIYRMIYFIAIEDITFPIKVKFDDYFKNSLLEIYIKELKNYKKIDWNEYQNFSPESIYNVIKKWSRQNIAYTLFLLPTKTTIQVLNFFDAERRNFIIDRLYNIINVNKLLAFDHLRYINVKLR